MFCINCGTKLPDNAKFCFSCGTSIPGNAQAEIQTQALETGPSKIFDIACGKKVCFNYDLRQHAEIRATFEKSATQAKDLFSAYMDEKVSNFEELYGEAFDTFLKLFNAQLNTALDILINHGFDLYSVDMLKEKVWNHLEGSHGWKLLQEYNQPKDNLVKFINQNQERRTFERNNRGGWSGGGFGIKGALIGSINAGLLNLGTGALRGIGDAVVDAGDRRKIGNYMQSIYNEGKAESALINSLYFSSCDIGEYVYSILVDAKLLNATPFISYEMIEAKAANIYNTYKKGQYSKETAIEKLCDCVPLNPFDYDPLGRIYKIDPSTKANLLKIEDYLGYAPLLQNQMKSIDAGRLFND